MMAVPASFPDIRLLWMVERSQLVFLGVLQWRTLHLSFGCPSAVSKRTEVSLDVCQG